MIKICFLVTSVALLSLGQVDAALSAVSVSNLNTPITDNVGTALDAGSAADGDGFVYQIGYFTGDTNTFTGTWVALTGAGSANPGLVTTIGDSGGGPDGLISQSITFDDTIHNSLPAGGAQLAIRFYNSTLPNTATHFNTVTNTTWTLNAFSTPPSPSQGLNMDAAGLTWEDNSNPFATSIVIPEPSTFALFGLGGLAMLIRRRR